MKDKSTSMSKPAYLGKPWVMKESEVSSGKEGFPGTTPGSEKWHEYKSYYSVHMVATQP
jgi:hypothetical protein